MEYHWRSHQLPDAHVTLADISRPALAVAKRNIKRLKLMNRVTAVGLDARKRGPSFVGTLDALVCNPPYVTSEEMARLEPSVKEYEPALALDGGKDGLAFYRGYCSAERFARRCPRCQREKEIKQTFDFSQTMCYSKSIHKRGRN